MISIEIALSSTTRTRPGVTPSSAGHSTAGSAVFTGGVHLLSDGWDKIRSIGRVTSKTADQFHGQLAGQTSTESSISDPGVLTRSRTWTFAAIEGFAGCRFEPRLFR
jgi:hypothetical protein